MSITQKKKTRKSIYRRAYIFLGTYAESVYFLIKKFRATASRAAAQLTQSTMFPVPALAADAGAVSALAVLSAARVAWLLVALRAGPIIVAPGIKKEK